MKTILLVLACISTSVAFASSPYSGKNLSWDQIIESSRLLPAFPQIDFGNSLISIDELCTDSEVLRPFYPYQHTCAEWDHSGDHAVCSLTGTVRIETPIFFTKKECARFERPGETPDCAEYAEVSKEIPLTYQVPVFARNSYGDTAHPLFVKLYSIPACL